MELVKNQTSGKRHMPSSGEKTTLCGASLIQDCKENATWIEDSWLDKFPEDYGDSHMDCNKCANIFHS
jgi:hypothetical protein